MIQMIHDEGSGLATPFRRDRGLAIQLREEHANLHQVKYKTRTPIDLMIPNQKTRSGYFMARGMKIAIKEPYKELPGLEAEVLLHFRTTHSLRDRVRFQELVNARRMFIFFATTYLHLKSEAIAHYLGLDRSTLSHHIHRFIEEIDVDPQTQAIAQDIDYYLWTRHEQLRQALHY